MDNEFITCKNYYTNRIGSPPQSLESDILARMKEGWAVLYIVTVPDIPYNAYTSASVQYSYATATTITNPDGSITFQIPPIPPQQVSNTQSTYTIEICYYKKEWKDHPCPRCEYPFPNENDIGRIE
jgi:hypothetical protein